MQNATKISVICSAFNREKYINQCVESILNQSLKEIELILIDNGSSDSTGEIIDSFAEKDSRVLAIHNPKGTSYGRALNQGISLAKGDYIGIVESDDFIHPDMYKKFYDQINKYDSEVCIGGFNRYIDSRGIVAPEKPYDEVENYTYDDRPFRLKDFPFLLCCHESMWAKLYKKSFIKDIIFNTTGRYIDSAFITEVYCKAKKMIAIHERLYFYRIGNLDASSTGNENDKELIRILYDWETAKNVLKKYGVYDQYKEELYARASRPAYRFYKLTSKKYKHKFFKQWQIFTRELRTDTSFSFKYFKPEIKVFVRNVLKGNYKYPDCKDYIVKKFISFPFLETIIYPNREIKRICKINLYDIIREESYTEITFLNKIFSIKKDYQHLKFILRFLNYDVFTKKSKIMIEQNDIRQIIREELKKFASNEYTAITRTLIMRSIAIRELHQKVFPQFKGIYRGRKVAIIAAGPTLNYYTPIEGAINIGVNKTFKQKIVPLDYLFVLDWPNMRDVISEANHYREGLCKKFYGMPQEENHACFIPDVHCPDHVYRYYINNSWNDLREQFCYDLSTQPLPCFFSVSFQAIAFALWTQPDEIYLVGCDNDFSKHFDNSPLLSQDPRWIELHRIRTMDGYNKLKKFASIYYPDTKIISINPVGLKGIFEDRYTSNSLNKNS